MKRPFVLLAVVVLAACSNGSSVAPGPVPVTIPSIVPAPGVPLKLDVATPQGVAQFRVVATPIDGGASIVTTGVCPTSGCTMQVSAPDAHDRLDITLLDASGTTVYSGSVRIRPSYVQGRTYRLAFAATPASAAVSVEPATVYAGTSGSVEVSVVARDADGREIIGDAPFPQPYTVTASGGTLTGAQLTAPSSTLSLAFTGIAAPITVSANAADPTKLFLATHDTTSFGHPRGDALYNSVRSLSAIPTAPPQPAQGVGVRAVGVIPTSINLSAQLPPVGDQGNQESCEAWSSSYGILSYLWGQKNSWSFLIPGTATTDLTHVFSPAYLWNSLNGGKNVGLRNADVVAFLKANGGLPWAQFPWRQALFAPAPDATQLAAGGQYAIADYRMIGLPNSGAASDIPIIKSWLAAGYPILWSVNLDSSFDAMEYGNQPNPDIWPANGTFAGYGGHAMILIGYDDTVSGGSLVFRNSWGTSFGNGGIAYITYATYPKVTTGKYVLSLTPLGS